MGCGECTDSNNCSACTSNFTLSGALCYMNCTQASDCRGFNYDSALCTPSLSLPEQKVCMVCSLDSQCQTAFGRHDFKCYSGQCGQCDTYYNNTCSAGGVCDTNHVNCTTRISLCVDCLYNSNCRKYDGRKPYCSLTN